MSFQGIEFTPEMRKLVVNVKQFFKLNKKNQELFDAKSAISLTALAMGISESSVGKITAAFNKGGDDILSWSNAENRGRPPYTVEAGLETVSVHGVGGVESLRPLREAATTPPHLPRDELFR
jgi:hypothetical protein